MSRRQRRPVLRPQHRAMFRRQRQATRHQWRRVRSDTTGLSPASGPSVAITQYDPRTGSYVTPDGHVYRQSDLVAKKGPKTWKDLFPT